MRALRYVTGACSLILVAVLALAGATASWSPWGWLTLMAAALGAAALLSSAPRAQRLLGAAAAGLLVMVLGLRLYGTAPGQARMLTLPGGTPSRWASRIIDEQDTSLAGARILRLLWRLPRDEQARLVPAMRDAYVEMRREL